MPTVFQTGESVPRPVNPDRLYYTTPQKVGDLLQIPYPDGVNLAANASISDTFVLISPTDHRHTGFEEDDRVEIASEASMGEEAYVLSVVASGTDVRLNLKNAAGSAGTAYSLTRAHTTATYATVQNLQSFTNGKRRGVTKASVETLIKRTQDKIDNLTNNAWRPMLQTAEYVNFDTYKPYRRRYYTDYVGTAPLRFRNAQQILRLEIWQGQEYREVAAAEARVTAINQSALTTSDYLYLCPGGGGVASLRVGTGTGDWRADFDDSTTIQNLADLINKDFNRNKSAVAFSPSFSVEDAYGSSGLTIANVHHEFLASANADYGAGKMKITSMSRGEGGQNATIATTNLEGLSIGNVNNPSTTITSLSGSGPSTKLTVPSTAAFAPYGILFIGAGSSIKVAYYTAKKNAEPASLGSITAGGAGYVAETGVVTSGGEGTGLTVDITVTAGAVTGVTINTAGSGYLVDDIVTVIAGDENAKFVIASAITEFTGVTELTPTGFNAAATTGVTLHQNRMKIDYVGTTTGDEARLRDWWCDYELGIIYFNNTYPYFEWNAIKVTYVHGERYVEKAIEDISTKLVAMDLLISDDRTVLLPEGTSNIDLGSKYQLLKAQVAETLPRYVEVLTLD